MGLLPPFTDDKEGGPKRGVRVVCRAFIYHGHHGLPMGLGANNALPG
ncbi:hypothetical protein OAS67_00965 [Alphaproteobacteria bacterium]|nr:hypothetical protein [Alphaproteobacteria bacterium]